MVFHQSRLAAIALVLASVINRCQLREPIKLTAPAYAPVAEDLEYNFDVLYCILSEIPDRVRPPQRQELV